MKRSPVVQEELTGCGIASCAAIAQISYSKAKKIANNLGIFTYDRTLWSQTNHVKKILKKLGYKTQEEETPFSSWRSLPDLALLAIKWHLENGVPFWHWVVFIREKSGDAYVLDSKKSLRTNVRTDFGRIRPKWSIKCIPHNG
jgi:ABC-type bacteriocin/lantibiotic exporter with double-glycine peptidase domain